ncbi:MAG: 2,3-diaminopropionate biosynthesis protein SbnB [Candidatus Pristimantibacillus sp.]
MRYLNERDLLQIGMDWDRLVDLINTAAAAHALGECAQPIKPYLKFGNERNRIIAMPAYVSRPIRAAGLKWIASFPDNIASGLPRAHSVTLVNDPDTGAPAALIKGSLISAIRTAAVSAALLQSLLTAAPRTDLEVAIIGMGPIGRMHAQMLNSLFGNHRVARIRAYDQRDIDVEQWLNGLADFSIPVERSNSWQEAYREADLVFTCTASIERYIDEAPKPSSLLMHISLRDYSLQTLAGVGAIIVDHWEEVCRADTDIERLHQYQGLQAEHTVSLATVLENPQLVMPSIDSGKAMLFAPMGLAVFDIAIAAYYVSIAEALGIGIMLD